MPINHQYPRTERDLRWLAVNFTAGNITKGLPERLECLAAWHRVGVEANKAANGEPHKHTEASLAFNETVDRLHAAGVGYSEGEFTFSPCCGPDVVYMNYAEAMIAVEAGKRVRSREMSVDLLVMKCGGHGRVVFDTVTENWSSYHPLSDEPACLPDTQAEWELSTYNGTVSLKKEKEV